MTYFYCLSAFLPIFIEKIEFDMQLPKKLGRPKKFESPEQLWDLAVEYFEYTDNNPWKSGELVKSGELAGVVVEVKKRLPYTWAGLEVFSIMKGMPTRMDEYRFNRKGGYEDFSDVVAQVERVLFSQKFNGATVGDFNPMIITRDLGLAEKVVTETKDTTDDFDYDSLSDEALKEIAAARIKSKNV